MTKTGAALVEEVNRYSLAPGAAAFWWLGQSGFIVKIGKTVLYLDAFLMPGPKRQVAPLLKPEEVTNADWVFGTHDHSDHIDPYAFQGITAASPHARFVCPRAVLQRIRELGIPDSRLVPMDEGIVVTDEEHQLRIEAVASAHEFLDYQPGVGYPYLSYIIQVGGITILHTGDTTIYEGYLTKLSKWSFDLMFLPINGRDGTRLRSNCIGNMTYQEAVDMAGTLKPRLAVPGHYDMFAYNGENPMLFVDYLEAKYPMQRCWVGKHGEPVQLEPR